MNQIDVFAIGIVERIAPTRSRALEIKNVLMRYFQGRLDAESDRLWDEGVLDQERLEELRHKDLHAEA